MTAHCNSFGTNGCHRRAVNQQDGRWTEESDGVWRQKQQQKEAYAKIELRAEDREGVWGVEPFLRHITKKTCFLLSTTLQ